MGVDAAAMAAAGLDTADESSTCAAVVSLEAAADLRGVVASAGRAVTESGCGDDVRSNCAALVSEPPALPMQPGQPQCLTPEDALRHLDARVQGLEGHETRYACGSRNGNDAALTSKVEGQERSAGQVHAEPSNVKLLLQGMRALEERVRRLEESAASHASAGAAATSACSTSTATAARADAVGMPTTRAEQQPCSLDATTAKAAVEAEQEPPPQNPQKPRRQLGRTQSAPEPPSRAAMQEGSCCICMAAPRECAFTPCGHRCVCRVCGITAVRTDRRCPICRVAAGRVLRILDP